MSYLAAAYTDQGIVKESNQDSLCVMEAQTRVGNILMAVICDGMGGLAKGEVASASVIQALARWFAWELPTHVTEENHWQAIQRRWYQLLLDENQKIGNYGRERGLQLGTTVSALLLYKEERYLVIHVGDSRIYCMDDQRILQLTEDQTVTASEVRAGRMTPQEAEQDPRQNVLLQCIGATPKVQPVMMEGEAYQNLTFLLCSDGFRRKITQEDIHRQLRPGTVRTEKEMEQHLVQLTETDKKRQEQDNISSILIKVI